MLKFPSIFGVDTFPSIFGVDTSINPKNISKNWFFIILFLCF